MPQIPADTSISRHPPRSVRAALRTPQIPADTSISGPPILGAGNFSGIDDEIELAAEDAQNAPKKKIRGTHGARRHSERGRGTAWVEGMAPEPARRRIVVIGAS